MTFKVVLICCCCLLLGQGTSYNFMYMKNVLFFATNNYCKIRFCIHYNYISICHSISREPNAIIELTNQY